MTTRLLRCIILAALAVPALAVAVSAQTSAYAWADEPTSSAYAPSALYSYSSTGQPIRVARNGMGTYAVTFEGLGGNGRAGGHVQVTAYGPGSEMCKVVNWNSGGADFIVGVRCYDAAGNPVDTRYAILVTWPDRSSAGPRTHSTGELVIPQTWAADLDEGSVTTDAASDIWFEAVTATERYVTPRNGATIARVGTTSVGGDGCARAPLGATRISLSELPVGTYVCVRTNGGRYSQFRVNAAVGASPGELRIGYTTWAAP